MKNRLKDIFSKNNWKMTRNKELQSLKPFIEQQVKELKLDSVAEYIYHLKNDFKIINHICICGSKKKFRGTKNKRYGDFCSTKCANLAQAKDIEKQKRKSESCKKHYRENNTAKERGKNVSKFYKELKENDLEKYEEYRLKKDQTLRKIWNSFDTEKINRIKEKMSKSSKEWYNTLPQEKKDQIITSCNEGFQHFLQNMSKEEKQEFENKKATNRKQNNLNKYGVKYTNQLPENKEKIKETTLKKWGVEYIGQHPEIQKKRRKTNEERGNWITEDQVQNFKDYSRLVWRYTNQQPIHKLKNFEKRGHANQGKYHLDHKFSIFEGYKQNVPAKIIGNICNLEMIIGRNNLSKNKKCSVLLEELLESFKRSS